MTTTLPPANLELEKSVIGSCLIDPSGYRQIEAMLKTADFFLVKHGWIWDAFGELAQRGEPVNDITLLGDELEREHRLNGLGGMAYLMQCTNSVTSACHIRQYATRVTELAERRRTINFATDLAKAAYNENGRFVSEKAKITAQLQKDSGTRRDVVTAREAMNQVYDDVAYNIEHPLRPGEVRHLSTGLRDLDSLIGGLALGLHIIGATTSTGKTAFCMAIASNVAERGDKVFYASPEMTADQLIERIVCALTKIDSRKLDTGRLTKDELARFAEVTGMVSEWPLVISEATAMQDIQAQIYREQPRLIVIDGIELIIGGTKESTHERLGEVTKWAKAIVKDPDILAPVLLPAQIATKKVANRADKRPVRGDFYHSSEEEMWADVVMTLHRPDVYRTEKDAGEQYDHRLEVMLWKYRIGRRKVPDIAVLRFGSFGDITDLETQQQAPPPIDF